MRSFFISSDPDANLLECIQRAHEIEDYDDFDHPLSSLSPTRRVDEVLKILDHMPIQEAGGFSAETIADLAGVKRQTVVNRIALAKSKAAKRLEEKLKGEIACVLDSFGIDSTNK